MLAAREEIAKLLTAPDLSEAQRRTRDWAQPAGSDRRGHSVCLEDIDPMACRLIVALGVLALMFVCPFSRSEAADLDSATAAYQSGDHAQAFAEFSQLADGGDPMATLWVGYLYEQGEGTQQDYGEAMRHYRMAADLGVPEANQYVANLYYAGLGVERDLVEAVRWYRKGAVRDNADSQYSLGYMYENGEGAPRDLRAARRWYEAAASHDQADARAALERLGD